MSIRYINPGQSFFLLTQLDGESGVYADEAARDAYFATPNGIIDLARMDVSEFIIIKLLDGGAGVVVYQQRVEGVFLDTTTLIQGETGPAGATGNSFFFESIAARDAFFNTVGNEVLLMTGLPVVVNEGTVATVYYWSGADSPPTYDEDLFRPASIGAAPGSLVLGKDGLKISSASRDLNIVDAYGQRAIAVTTRYDKTGNTPTFTWDVAAAIVANITPTFDTQLSDPQELLLLPATADTLFFGYAIRPATSGPLRVCIFAGTDANAPVISDTTLTVDPGDVGTLFAFDLINSIIAEIGDSIFVTLSGIDLFGGVQASGDFVGQTKAYLDAETSLLTQNISSGDVTGPAVSVDNAIARFDGTTGKVIQNSLARISEDGFLNLFSNVATSGRNEFNLYDSTGTLTFDISRVQNGAPLRMRNHANTNFEIRHLGTTGAIQINTPQGAQEVLLQRKTMFLNTGALNRLRVQVDSANQAAEIDIADSSGIHRWELRYTESSDTLLEESEVPHTWKGKDTITIDDDQGVELISRVDPTKITAGTAVTDPNLEQKNIAGTISSKTYLTDADPNSVITGVGGDFAIRDQADLSQFYFNQALTTGTVWNQVSLNPPSMIEILTASQLEDLATADVIEITEDTVFIFKSTVFSTVVFNVTGGSLVIRMQDNVNYFYTGTDTVMTSTGPALFLERFNLICTSTGTYFGITGSGAGALFVNNSFFAGGSIGTVNKLSTAQAAPAVIMVTSSFNNFTSGLVCTDCVAIQLVNIRVNRLVASGDAFLQYSNPTFFAPSIAITTGFGLSQSTDFLIRIDAGFQKSSSASVTNNNYGLALGADYFDTSGIAPTAFDSVADVSIGATTTNVTDNSGVAVFNHVGASPPIGSTVVISGFTANPDYNTTGRVTVSTATLFELEYVAFGSPESAGSYFVDAVRVTSVSHGLDNGTGVTLDTTAAIDYDGHFISYGVTANTFDVAKAFTETKEGFWNTRGLDQTDPQVLSLGNPGFSDSTVKSEISVQANSLSTNNPLAGARILINASPWTTQQSERIKSDEDGHAIFFGNEPAPAKLDGNLLLEPAGGPTTILSCQFVRQDVLRNVVTFTNGTNLINETGTTLVDGDNITFHDNAGTLPAELREDIIYFVVTAAANSFQVSYTLGGAVVTFTDNGSGTNSYAVADFHGSRPSEPIAASGGARTLVPQALMDIENGDKVFITISNDGSNDIDVIDAYYRLVI